MAKKVTGQVKLQIPAGKATPAPPGRHGAWTAGRQHHGVLQGVQREDFGKDQEGLIIPVVITIFSDRSFTFITKTPPVPVLIKRAVAIAKGSPEPHKTKVGKITAEAGRGDRQDQDAGSELLRCRSGDPLGQRHGPLHGHRRSLISLHVQKGVGEQSPTPFLFVRHEFANVLVGIMPALLAHRLRQSTEFNQTMQHTVTALRARPFLV